MDPMQVYSSTFDLRGSETDLKSIKQKKELPATQNKYIHRF